MARLGRWLRWTAAGALAAALRAAASNESNASEAAAATTSAAAASGGENATTSAGLPGNGTVSGASFRFPLCDLGPQAPVSIGDRIPICVFLSTDPPKKMVFRVKVEEYAELVLQGSQALAFNSTNKPVYTWAAVSGSLNSSLPLDCGNASDVDRRSHLASCPQVYATGTHMVHLLSLVINLHDGFVHSFAWDSSCEGCGPNACIQSKKAIDLQQGTQSWDDLGGACGAETGGCRDGAGCDMKVFVTWAGTDKEGRHCTSAGMRMSKFTGYTLTSLYEKANQNYKSIT